MLKIDNVFSKRQTNSSYKQTKTNNKQHNKRNFTVTNISQLLTVHITYFYSLLFTSTHFYNSSWLPSKLPKTRTPLRSRKKWCLCVQRQSSISWATTGENLRSIVTRSIQRLYDVKLTVIIDPIREFNPNDWTSKFYDDPQIVVTWTGGYENEWTIRLLERSSRHHSRNRHLHSQEAQGRSSWSTTRF